jgi:hypothetical protein
MLAGLVGPDCEVELRIVIRSAAAPMAAPAAAPILTDGLPLSEMEKCILTAIGPAGGPAMTAKDIATKAGYCCNSHFRSVLAGLVRRGYLESGLRGYRRLVADREEARP